jgi:hypothetical protein
LQFVVYLVTVLKFEAIFYWFGFQNPQFIFSRAGNDVILAASRKDM